MLVRHFVQDFNHRNNRSIEVIPSDTTNVLVRYAWPGNVRELQNVIECAVIVSTGPVLQVPIGDLEPGTPASAARTNEKNLRGLSKRDGTEPDFEGAGGIQLSDCMRTRGSNAAWIEANHFTGADAEGRNIPVSPTNIGVRIVRQLRKHAA